MSFLPQFKSKLKINCTRLHQNENTAHKAGLKTVYVGVSVQRIPPYKRPRGDSNAQPTDSKLATKMSALLYSVHCVQDVQCVGVKTSVISIDSIVHRLSATNCSKKQIWRADSVKILITSC